MPDSKITALTSISTSTDPANDPLVIVDVSDTSMAATGTTKKVTLNNLLACSPTATLASATITGDLTVDTSTLKVDSANNFVGVGTTTGVNLAAGRGNLTIGGSSSAILNLSIGATDTGYVIHDGTSISLVNRIAAGSLIFSTNSTERFRIDSSGNVGIGVTPSAKLDVRGPNNGNQAIFTGTASRGLVISTRDDGLANDRTVVFNAAYAAGSLGQLAFQTAGTDRVLMKNNGQLRFVPLAADPAGAEAGDVYYNSTSNKLKCYNGTTWNDLF